MSSKKHHQGDAAESTSTATPPASKLIVIKLGTSVLTAGTRRLSRRRMLELMRQAAQLHEQGHRVVVVSSGAIAAGREALNYPELGKLLPGKQMLAAVGQGRLIQIYTELFSLFEINVGQVLLTRGDLAHRMGYLNARDTLLTLLEHRIIPVINENDTVATDEIRVGDNDNLSALIANLIDADLLLLLTDQAGFYTADPRTDPTATLMPVIEVIDDAVWARAGGTSTGLGTGGMFTKLQAAQLAGRSGTTTVMASGALPNIILDIVAGQGLGTTFLPSTPHRESRKRWLLSEKPSAAVRVDAGAASKLRRHGASLLGVGITTVLGDFDRGDVVRVVSADDHPLAVGIANYASSETQRLVGVRSSQIESVLGYSYGDEIIHRDNMVIL